MHLRQMRKDENMDNNEAKINVNGVEYVRADLVLTNPPKALGNKIVIVPNGFILVGQQIEHEYGPENIMLVNASVVRKWTNGRGLGALAKAEYKNEYELDSCYGAVTIPVSAVNFIIDCEW